MVWKPRYLSTLDKSGVPQYFLQHKQKWRGSS